MKKVILFLMFFVYTVYSQNGDPVPMLFHYNGQYQELEHMEQTEFLTGFEYSGEINLDSMLFNNSKVGTKYDTTFFEKYKNYEQIQYPLLHPNFITYHQLQEGSSPHYEGWTPSGDIARNCAAIEWEPTLEIPEAQRGKTVEIPTPNLQGYDYVFGFSNTNYDEITNEKIILHNGGNFINTSADSIILSRPWVEPLFILYRFSVNPTNA